jgi:hypothetical protein
MQWQEHKFANPSHSNPTKATNAMERYERKNKKEIQDLHPLCSPHLEQRWIGENIDLDLLSLSLKDMQESWEELREGQAFQGPTMEEREKRKLPAQGGRTRPFIGLPMKYDYCSHFSTEFSSQKVCTLEISGHPGRNTKTKTTIT